MSQRQATKDNQETKYVQLVFYNQRISQTRAPAAAAQDLGTLYTTANQNAMVCSKKI